MDKGYYTKNFVPTETPVLTSQSTIKMDKGYYDTKRMSWKEIEKVAIHNKNGQGLLP